MSLVGHWMLLRSALERGTAADSLSSYFAFCIFFPSFLVRFLSCPAFHRPIMWMRFQMVLSARPTKEMSDLLRIFLGQFSSSSGNAVLTVLAGRFSSLRRRHQRYLQCDRLLKQLVELFA